MITSTSKSKEDDEKVAEEQELERSAVHQSSHRLISCGWTNDGSAPTATYSKTDSAINDQRIQHTSFTV